MLLPRPQTGAWIWQRQPVITDEGPGSVTLFSGSATRGVENLPKCDIPAVGTVLSVIRASPGMTHPNLRLVS